MEAIALLLAFGIGIATAAQSPTNGILGTIVGPMQASLVSFTGGLLILAVLCAFIGTGDITKVTEAPLWLWTGGLYAAYIVFIMTVCTRTLGVAFSLTLIMLGQLSGGMVIDTWGLMESEVAEVSALRLAGAVLVLAGIILVYLSRLREEKNESAEKASAKSAEANTSEAAEAGASAAKSGTSKAGTATKPSTTLSNKLILQAILVFSAGVASAMQAPTNAGLCEIVGTLESSVISFAGGFLILLVATLIAGKGRLNSFKGVKAWHLTGGIYGAYGVPSLIVATPILGVSLVMGGSMAGQLIGGMIIDTFGFFGMQKRRIDRLRLAAAIILLIGVLLVTAGTN